MGGAGGSGGGLESPCPLTFEEEVEWVWPAGAWPIPLEEALRTLAA